jgi:hypothetical protein
MLASRFAHSLTLKMEEKSSSETSVVFQLTTQYYILEVRSLHCNNLFINRCRCKRHCWYQVLFVLRIVGVESKLGPLGTAAIYCPIVPAPGDCEDGEFGGMNGRGNRSTRSKPAPAPLCPPQIPLDQTRDRTRDAVVGSQRLIA